MPFLRHARIVSLASLAICACKDQPPLEPEVEVSNRSAPWSQPTRYIGVLPWSPAPLPVCPTAPSWNTWPLFSVDAQILMPLLSRYCVYTWTEVPPYDFSATFVAAHVRLDPDPDIVVPQASLSKVRAERTLQALGALPASSSPPLGWSSSGVYVAIVDNADSTPIGQLAPPIDNVPRAQLHGSSMRRLIDKVRCPFEDEGEPEGENEDEDDGRSKCKGDFLGESECKGDVDGEDNGDVDGADNGDVDGADNGGVDGEDKGDVDGEDKGDVDGEDKGEIDGEVERECREWHFFEQAFPYDSNHAEPFMSSGELGSLGSLAHAVGQSVVEWKNRNRDWHLVINMSLGWDPAYEWIPEPREPLAETGEADTGAADTGAADTGAADTGFEPATLLPSGPYDLPLGFDPYAMLVDSDTSMPAPVQAVYASLAWAACQGALSIAAAGNNRGPRCEQRGPMAPASWEVHSISPEICDAFGLELSPEQEGPLVYAAGGLDADRPIANARLDSMPRRALHASLVNVPNGHPESLTGTSLASAALSAIAATLWSQQPRLSAAEIMQQIHDSGTPLSLPVEWGDSLGDDVLRIDAHAALSATGLAANPYLPRSSATLTGGTGTLAAAIDSMIDSVGHAPFSPASVAQNLLVAGTGCAPAAVTIHGNLALPVAPDPHADETRPQPTIPICPNCAVRKKSSLTSTNPQWALYLNLDLSVIAPTASALTVEPTLTFFDDTTSSYIEVQLGPFQYAGPVRIDLQSTALGDPPTQVSGWLTSHSWVTTGLLGLKVSTIGPPRWYVDVVEVVP